MPIRLLLRPNHNCADTPTVPPTVRSCRYACDPRLPLASYCYNKRLYCPATVDETMIVPLRLRLLDQLIARALRLTYYHKITDRRAPCSTAIVTAASTVLLPEHSCSCLQLNLNLTTTAPACVPQLTSAATPAAPRTTLAALPAASHRLLLPHLQQITTTVQEVEDKHLRIKLEGKLF